MTVPSRLVLFTRLPVPGEAKTRLIPALGAEGAADLHRRLTERTLEVLDATRLPVEVWTTGGNVAAFRKWLGDRTFVDQGAGDLGERMLRALGRGPAIVVGSDIPAMQRDNILRAADLLARHEAVFGPASDGGYWLVGTRRPLPVLFEGIEWGRDGVLAETLGRAKAAGIDVALGDELDDLDSADDLLRWPELTV